MYKALIKKEKRIAVIGLGYVGLPLSLILAKKFSVIGFDINKSRIEMMKNHIDPSKELEKEAFVGADIHFTTEVETLKQADFYIVAVPTPIDDHKIPNLKPIIAASTTVGKVIEKGNYVVYESTVYPGCTEEDCIPVIEKESGLVFEKDFKVGYSPERINSGDKKRTVEKILKIVSGSDQEALEEISKVYSKVIIPGVYKAKSIKVAEAAKVIENVQRDLNISLMNELAIIFDKLDIDTKSVLEAAGTKWNFLKFTPGLVGGHCIGVDPYYLVHKSKQIGYDPQVILSGRRINDKMPAFVAKRLIQKIIKNDKNPNDAKVLVMGITFKEDVSDIRNSKVADLVKELMDYSIDVHLVDPHATSIEVWDEYQLKMTDQISDNYDAIIVAVGHQEYRGKDENYFKSLMNKNPILMDLKGIYEPFTNGIDYWRL